jgi:hypothetical protein
VAKVKHPIAALAIIAKLTFLLSDILEDPIQRLTYSDGIKKPSKAGFFK